LQALIHSQLFLCIQSLEQNIMKKYYNDTIGPYSISIWIQICK